MPFPIPTRKKGAVRRHERLWPQALRQGSKRIFGQAGGLPRRTAKVWDDAQLGRLQIFLIQVWQKGMAEVHGVSCCELAARRHKPSKAFRALKDFGLSMKSPDGSKTNIIKGFHAPVDHIPRVRSTPLGGAKGCS